MNTDKVIKLLPGVIALGGMAYLASTSHPARYLFEAAVIVSYGAVVALLALTAIDYRGSANSYASR